VITKADGAAGGKIAMLESLAPLYKLFPQADA
jgi:hypothetical protein